MAKMLVDDKILRKFKKFFFVDKKALPFQTKKKNLKKIVKFLGNLMKKFGVFLLKFEGNFNEILKNL